jgi:hypothetical protein
MARWNRLTAVSGNQGTDGSLEPTHSSEREPGHKGYSKKRGIDDTTSVHGREISANIIYAPAPLWRSPSAYPSN